MSRMQTLLILLEREQAERDRARAAWEAAHRGATDARRQAEQLTTYRADYNARWSERFATQASIEIVRCYHGFVGRLEQAIAQQEHVATRAHVQRDDAQARLRVAETRVASVERLIERRRATERALEERRDQKSVDEMAQRLGMVRSAALGQLMASA